MRLFRSLIVVTAFAASAAFAGDPNCENRAAKSAVDCQKACAKMKDTPELKNSMKSARIGSCDQMCSMVEDQSRKACEKRKKERRK